MSTGSFPTAPGAPPGQRTIGVSGAAFTSGAINASKSMSDRSRLWRVLTLPPKWNFGSNLSHRQFDEKGNQCTAILQPLADLVSAVLRRILKEIGKQPAYLSP